MNKRKRIQITVYLDTERDKEIIDMLENSFITGETTSQRLRIMMYHYLTNRNDNFITDLYNMKFRKNSDESIRRSVYLDTERDNKIVDMLERDFKAGESNSQKLRTMMYYYFITNSHSKKVSDETKMNIDEEKLANKVNDSDAEKLKLFNNLNNMT